MNGLPCPPLRASLRAFTTAGESAIVGSAHKSPTVFSGVTDVGDIVLGPPASAGTVSSTPPKNATTASAAPRRLQPDVRDELCGTDVVDPGEECDGTPGCTDLCTLCGDDLVRIPGEECDLGSQNGVADSGCSAGAHRDLRRRHRRRRGGM